MSNTIKSSEFDPESVMPIVLGPRGTIAQDDQRLSRGLREVSPPTPIQVLELGDIATQMAASDGAAGRSPDEDTAIVQKLQLDPAPEQNK